MRDYKSEYARRIARGAAKGVSRSQARGHPKPAEAAVSSKRPPKPIADDRLQLALRVLRQEKSLAAAARAAKISPERLRHYATQRDIIERQGPRWIVRHQLPRRMLLFSDGSALQVIVGDFDSASKVGRFMSAVSHFLRTNNPAGLREFEGVSITCKCRFDFPQKRRSKIPQFGGRAISRWVDRRLRFWSVDRDVSGSAEWGWGEGWLCS